MSINIQIIKLSGPNDVKKAYCCMAEVPTPYTEALCQCQNWLVQNIGKHIEGYHIELDNREVVGHLYYASSEMALFPYSLEPNVCVLYCEWVQRRFQNQGLGKRLFDNFVDDQIRTGSKGIVVETNDQSGQMHSQIYLRRGFKVLHEKGDVELLYLPLTQAEIEYHSHSPKQPPRHQIPIEIVIINGFMCPAEIATQLLLLGVAQEFKKQVKLRQVWLSPEILHKYGSIRGILINGKQKLGSGETEESIRAAILDEIQHAT